MIIPDHEIKKLIKEGKLIVEPIEDPEDQIQPAWIELRLGSEFRVFRYTTEPFIDSKNPKEYTTFYKTDGEPFILHPKEFVLGITYEKIKIPSDHAAYVDGRSSLGRLGITAHITSGWVDPGFEGRLVLEISNLGKMPVTIYPKMKICKLVIFKLTSPAEFPYNKRKNAKYYQQNRVIESKIFEETDF